MRPTTLALALAILLSGAAAAGDDEIEAALRRMRTKAGWLELEGKLLEIKAQEKYLAAKRLRIEAEMMLLKRRMGGVGKGTAGKASVPDGSPEAGMRRVRAALWKLTAGAMNQEFEGKLRRYEERLKAGKAKPRPDRVKKARAAHRRTLVQLEHVLFEVVYPEPVVRRFARILRASPADRKRVHERTLAAVNEQYRNMARMKIELPHITALLFSDREAFARDLLRALAGERAAAWAIELAMLRIDPAGWIKKRLRELLLAEAARSGADRQTGLREWKELEEGVLARALDQGTLKRMSALVFASTAERHRARREAIDEIRRGKEILWKRKLPIPHLVALLFEHQPTRKEVFLVVAAARIMRYYVDRREK